jgi:AraC-like DNA-binding protein
MIAICDRPEGRIDVRNQNLRHMVFERRSHFLHVPQHFGRAERLPNDPSHPWTLQALAERGGMSRSTFAQKFKQAVCAPPMEYLTR